MNTFNLTLDLDKRGGVAQWVTLRQGDRRGTELRATIYDHGTQAGGGYTCRVSIRLPGAGDEYYRETATYTNGVAVVTVDEEYAAAIVGVTEGYFELLQGDAVIASTESFGVRVLRSAQDGAVPGDKYDSAIEDALAELDEATGRISQMVVDATEEYLEAHPELTTTVEDNSLTDIKLIQHGGILDRVARLWHRLDNLLTATPAESDSLTVTDAAKTPLAGLALYGRSTQDGTPTPSSPVAIQSVEGNLADPSSMFNGYPLNSGIVASSAQRTIYVPCEPNTTYTVSKLITAAADRFAISDSPAVPAGGGTCARPTTIQGTNSDTYVGVRVARTYTTSATAKYLLVWIGTSRTYVGSDPAIYLGETYVPYVPYSCVGLWAQGKNLLDPSTFASRGNVYTVNADGSVTVTATDGALWANVPTVPLGAGTYTFTRSNTSGTSAIGFVDASGTPISYVYIASGTATTTFTAPANTASMRFKVGYGASSYPFTTTVQLELGSTATAYQPYAESMTPIPLQGHALRSLPDGTRDEVAIDQYGHAILTVRCGEFTVTDDVSGIAAFGVNSNGTGWYYNYSSSIDAGISSTGTDNSGLCDLGAYYADGTDGIDHFYVYGTRVYCRIAEQLADAAAATAWYNAHKPTLVYKLAEPQTIDLGTIDPVALQGPDMTAQAVPTAPFALTYERDLNTTLARLEAAIADAATA